MTVNLRKEPVLDQLKNLVGSYLKTIFLNQQIVIITTNDTALLINSSFVQLSKSDIADTTKRQKRRVDLGYLFYIGYVIYNHFKKI